MKRLQVNQFEHSCHCNIKVEPFTTSGCLNQLPRRDTCISRALALRYICPHA